MEHALASTRASTPEVASLGAPGTRGGRALQEIDTRTRDPFSYFGELFGWTTVSVRTLAARDGHYGHIVLSRWPIESLGEVDLSVRWREPRKAIVGAIDRLADAS